MGGKVTINDVAREAGVSVGTVYRAVNNSGRIKDETRIRVLETVERLGYKANTVARGLALRSKFRILVIFPQAPEFFWQDVIKGARRAAAELSEFGVQIIEFIHQDGTAHGKRIMDVLADQKVDAIAMSIVALEDSGLVLQYASDHHIPIAVVNEDTVSRDRLVFYGPDDHKAGRMAAEFMVKFCGPGGTCCAISTLDTYIGQSRYREEGFHDYISRHSGTIDFAGTYRCSLGETSLLINRLLKEHPEINGFYIMMYTALLRIYQLFAGGPGKYIVIGHEYDPQFREPLRDGTITALLVQEKVCQGYYPVKMLYQFLVTGEKPAQDTYYSNINIIIGENLDCLQHNLNGCGYE